MSSSHSTARRLSKQRTKHSPTKPTMLPKAVRDELRMCVALRGYSTIRGGFGKKLDEQFVLMQDFFHGKSTHAPSQIKMLVDGQLAYAALYDTKATVVTSKKTKSKKKKESPVQLYLKPSLTRIDNTQFVQYVDITVDDLERKLRKGKAILHGRQLEAMAKKGLKNYRKALSFTKDKWDLKKNVPIESGTTIDDTINYVRLRMYKSLILKKGQDDDDDDEVVMASNNDINSKESPNAKNDFLKDVESEHVSGSDDDDDMNQTENNENDDNDNDDNEVNGSDTNVDDDPTTNLENENIANMKKTNTNDNEDDSSFSGSDTDSDSDGSNEKSVDDENFVPSDYIFPSFMAYVLWGPFAEDKDKLSLFCTDDAPKAAVKSRAEKRKEALQLKKVERENDRSTVRGFSTDQRINIQALNISQKRLDHQRNQSFLVSLSIQESAMSRQVEAAEKRAMIRCPEYDATNMHWKVADNLANELSVLVKSISEKTEKLFSNSNTAGDEDEIEMTVGTFLNQPSPTKKKRKTTVGSEEVLVLDDESSDDAFVDTLLNDSGIMDTTTGVDGIDKGNDDFNNVQEANEGTKAKSIATRSKVNNVSTTKKRTSQRKKKKK